MEHYFILELGYKDSSATLKVGKFRVKFELSDSRFVVVLLTPLFVEVLREVSKSGKVNKDFFINALLDSKGVSSKDKERLRREIGENYHIWINGPRSAGGAVSFEVEVRNYARKVIENAYFKVSYLKNSNDIVEAVFWFVFYKIFGNGNKVSFNLSSQGSIPKTLVELGDGIILYNIRFLDGNLDEDVVRKIEEELDNTSLRDFLSSLQQLLGVSELYITLSTPPDIENLGDSLENTKQLILKFIKANWGD
jgi:hypothetical protein